MKQYKISFTGCPKHQCYKTESKTMYSRCVYATNENVAIKILKINFNVVEVIRVEVSE